jgi:signal transduction histidine kinase
LAVVLLAAASPHLAARYWPWRVTSRAAVETGSATPEPRDAKPATRPAARTTHPILNQTPVTTVSAASYARAVAPEAIVAAFGSALATRTAAATDADPNTPGIQLPTELGGTTVEVNGRRAGLLFVSPNQVNFVIPAATETGATGVVGKLLSFTSIAANGDGVSNPQGASLGIVVEPGFWQTWWFRGLILLGAVVIIALLRQRWVSHLKRKRAEREQAIRKLIVSLENDRKRIAEELHDVLGYSLSIIKNRALHALSKLDDPGSIAEHLSEIVDAAGSATEEIHEIIYDLRPVQLDHKGLAKTVEDLIGKAAASCAISFSAWIDPIDDLLSEEAQIHLYRIVREGINNIIKHSGATSAVVLFKREAQGVRLVIQDDGQGFVSGTAEAAGSSMPGFGLAGITERARLIGGQCGIRSAPGQGTTITVKLSVEVQGDEQ